MSYIKSQNNGHFEGSLYIHVFISIFLKFQLQLPWKTYSSWRNQKCCGETGWKIAASDEPREI